MVSVRLVHTPMAVDRAAGIEVIVGPATVRFHGVRFFCKRKQRCGSANRSLCVH